MDTYGIKEFAPEMGDMKRPATSNHRLAKRPPKIPIAQRLTLEGSTQHTKHLQNPFLK